MTTLKTKIKMPGDRNKYQYFWYLTCGYDLQEIEGRIKDEDPVRYSAIKKIIAAKPLSWVELTQEEFSEISGFIEDAIDIKKDHVIETGQHYSTKDDWTEQRQEALINYYKQMVLIKPPQ